MKISENIMLDTFRNVKGVAVVRKVLVLNGNPEESENEIYATAYTSPANGKWVLDTFYTNNLTLVKEIETGIEALNAEIAKAEAECEY